MKRLLASAAVPIWGTRNAWSQARTSEAQTGGAICEVALEIQGTDRQGYNLVMSPKGFFTADYWYETLDDALGAATELFGTPRAAWSESSGRGPGAPAR